MGRLVLGEGDTAEIGEPIAVLLTAGETDADVEAALGRPTATGHAAPAPVAHREPAAAPAAQPAPGPAPAVSPTTAAARAPGIPDRFQRWFGDERAFLAWRADLRQSAGAQAGRERGVDLAGLAGTGPNGRIVRRDLERYLAAPDGSSAPLAETAASGQAEPAPVRTSGLEAAQTQSEGTTPAGDTLIPHTPMRRAIARRLTDRRRRSRIST